MSRHEGVSCDSCSKGNFRGRRYKCLICYDYDLCSTCYESGATTARHSTDHAMQCIITRSDVDLYYGGETATADQPQSYTCPFCAKLGYTESTLQDHVTADHADTTTEVVCPICAALLGGDPNHVTDDFASHLSLEHRAPRVLEDPMGIRHVRRIPHPSRGGARTRRSNMAFHTGSTTAGGGGGSGGAAANSSTASSLAALAPSTRDTMDPIAELLSQLSSVRSRAAAAQSVSSQLQQLEMQLQSTRYQASSNRSQLERLPRRQAADMQRYAPEKSALGGGACAMPQVITQQHQPTLLDYAGAVNANGNQPSSKQDSNFLLSKLGDPEPSEQERQAMEIARADRSVFVQELLLSSLSESLRLDDDEPVSEEDGVSTAEGVTGRSDSRSPSGTGALAANSNAAGAATTERSNPVLSLSRSNEPKCDPSEGGGGGAKPVVNAARKENTTKRGAGGVASSPVTQPTSQNFSNTRSENPNVENMNSTVEHRAAAASSMVMSPGGASSSPHNLMTSSGGAMTTQHVMSSAASRNQQAIRNKRKQLDGGSAERELVQVVKH